MTYCIKVRLLYFSGVKSEADIKCEPEQECSKARRLYKKPTNGSIKEEI